MFCASKVLCGSLQRPGLPLDFEDLSEQPLRDLDPDFPAFTTDLGALSWILDYLFVCITLRVNVVSTMDRCVNCRISTNRCSTITTHTLEDESILSVIRSWIAPEPVSNQDCICNACWILVSNSLNQVHTMPEAHPSSCNVGHRQVCVNCGCSTARSRNHQLRTDSDRERGIYNVIREWILPQQLRSTSNVCHRCWVRADKASRHFISRASTSSSGLSQFDSETSEGPPDSESFPQRVPETLPQHDLETHPQPNVENLHEPDADNQPASDVEDQPEPDVVIQPISRRQDTIVLPDYSRAEDCGSRCIIEGCQGSERFRLPIATRKMLLLQFNYYVPVNSCVCSNHLNTETWDFQAGMNAYSNAFNARHLQDMLHLKSTNVNALDFSNIKIACLPLHLS